MRDIWYYDTNLTPANIPASLTEIEDFAFYRNTPADPTLPPALKKIGRYAFYSEIAHFYSEIPELSIPNSVTSIGDSAFAYSIIEKVSLPSSLSEMGSGVFMGCKNLKSVHIPNGMSIIGPRAFCGSVFGLSVLDEVPISSINLPPSIKIIGDSAFYNCNMLTEISLPKGLEKLGKYAFSSAALKSVEMPDYLAEIPEEAFSGCPLQEINLPQGLKSIGSGAFSIGKFSEVSIPNSVDSIGESAFWGCGLLEKVIMSDRIKKLPYDLFHGCKSLKSLCSQSSANQSQSVNIPEGVESIGVSAFYGCSSISEVNIPEGVGSIGSSAFYGCSSISEVNIPSTVRQIDGNPFPWCEKLTDVHIDRRNSCYKTEDNVIFSIAGDTLVSFPASRGGSYTIPSSVSVIGAYSFSGNTRLEGITIPDGVLYIERGAFAGCSRLKDPVLPKNIVSIGFFAFADVQLTNVILPYSLKSIDRSFCCSLINDYSQEPEYHLESVRIYGTFDKVDDPIYSCCETIGSIYYLSEDIQGDDFKPFPNNKIDWGLDNYSNKTTLYVLKEAYDKIINDSPDFPWKYYPWSQFKDIRIYDPSDDPYFNSVEEVSGDIDTNLPLSVFSLSGVRVADSTDNLPSGIYIVRQGAKAKKIAVN